MTQYDPTQSGSSTPHFVVFFQNGLAAVCNAAGEQLPQYQAGTHDDVIEALRKDGYDWYGLNHTGRPLKPPFYDRNGDVIPAERYARPGS